MSLSTAFPGIRPTLLLDFCNANAVDPRITFTRNLAARYYDGETVAKAEENLVTFSQEFDISAWAKTRVTVTANNTAAPDGTSTAELVTQETGQTNAGAVFRASFVYPAAPLTFSVFAKADAKTFVRIAFFNSGGSPVNTWFNLQTGAVGTTDAGITASIVSAGSGWYRCICTYTPVSSYTQQAGGIYVSDTDNSLTVVDSGGIYIWGAQLEQRSAPTAYTPTTTAPITNYVPQLMTAAANVPRIDYDPITRVCRGLLIEESRQNLLLRSEEFNTTWTSNLAGVVGISADQTIAPDGTLTADLAQFALQNDGDIGLKQAVSGLTPSATYTFSAWVKAPPGFASRTVVLRLKRASGGTPTAAINTVTLTDQWQRVSVSLTLAADNNNIEAQFFAPLTTGATNVFLWGAQLEAGAFPTSYVATAGSAVTRPADAATMTGTNFSSWYRADAGTMFVNVDAPVGTGGNYTYSISDGTNSNYLYGFIVGSGTNRVRPLDVGVGGVSQASISVPSQLGLNLFAAAYRVNDFAASVNGGAIVSDTAGTVPVVNRLNIGVSALGTSGNLNGYIRKLAFYPARLPDAQLQALTR